MVLDTSEFPLVWMRNVAATGPSDADAVFTVFEELLRRGETFILMSEPSDHSPAHEHTQEEKKRTSLWMKKHRRELKLVKAMVMIEPSIAKRLAMKPFSMMFEKFWGYPMLMANNRDEALAIARKLLNDNASVSRPAAG
ncbi:hypothetical protein NKI56_21290 [Mesorhizobium sp. M0622]|uniref:hypothetical protein n=1 Tax=unclassified Mesorhizobium TaxID=325217 RepID=UPI00333D8A10